MGPPRLARAAAVVGELIEKLGRQGAPLAASLLRRVGELCAGVEDEDAMGEEGGPGRDQVVVAAQEALGAAMRSLGPEAVLGALPLGLLEVGGAVGAAGERVGAGNRRGGPGRGAHPHGAAHVLPSGFSQGARLHQRCPCAPLRGPGRSPTLLQRQAPPPPRRRPAAPLLQGLEGKGEARTWLLPLLRLHVRGARLAYWGSQLMPLARVLANRAVAASK